MTLGVDAWRLGIFECWIVSVVIGLQGSINKGFYICALKSWEELIVGINL